MPAFRGLQFQLPADSPRINKKGIGHCKWARREEEADPMVRLLSLVVMGLTVTTRTHTASLVIQRVRREDLSSQGEVKRLDQRLPTPPTMVSC